MPMPRLSHLTAAFILASAFGAAQSAQAADFSFKPFTESTVCPTCKPPPSDELTLSDGSSLHAKVIAINSDFYTLSLFGEIRTIPKSQVKSVKWQNGSQPSGIDALDQIVVKTGHVLTGNFTSEEKGFKQIRVLGLPSAFMVLDKVTDVFYKRGRQG